MKVPRTQYVDTNNGSIAYQAFGSGAHDIVIAPGMISHLDLMWTNPAFVEYAERISAFARIVTFDKRGTGLSDAAPGAARFDQRMADIVTVMDAAGLDRASIFGISEGGPLCCLFAATYPERVERLILFGTFSRGASFGSVLDQAHEAIENWGDGLFWPLFKPPGLQHTAAQLQTYGLFERAAASPSVARKLLRAIENVDINPILPSIEASTLVIHRKNDPFCGLNCAEELAEHIPDAKLVVLEGDHHVVFEGDSASVVDEIERFVTGSQRQRVGTISERTLATVLFTDIVGSTERAASLGDSAWKQLLDRHNTLARDLFKSYGGREVKSTGDGFLATFGAPAAAIECAKALTVATREINVEVSAGIHTGECEMIDQSDLGGIAVHIAARILDLADAGEVFVSGTVKDLVVGSDFEFDARGVHELKGVPGQWPVWSARGRGEEGTSTDATDRVVTLSDRAVLAVARRAPQLLRRITAALEPNS